MPTLARGAPWSIEGKIEGAIAPSITLHRSNKPCASKKASQLGSIRGAIPHTLTGVPTCVMILIRPYSLHGIAP